jgi:charged multivesicular body protein 5
MYETQRDQMYNQQFNVDQTSFAIETVRSTQTTVATMKTAAKTLKKENKKINLSEIEDMQDEMEGGRAADAITLYDNVKLTEPRFLCADMLEDVGEIGEILGRSYGCPDGVEEEDLDAELACLDDEIATDEVDFATSEAAPASRDSYLSNLPANPTAAPSVFSRAEATASAPQASSAYNALA